jgi:two-component system response regulator AtoC
MPYVPGSSEERTKSKALSAAIASDRPRLHAFWPGGHTSVELPDSGVLTVGRALECDLRIDDESVSRRHISVHCGGRFDLEDLGSWNGTRVSGRMLQPKETVLLRSGDVVELGTAMLVLRSAFGDAALHGTAAKSGARGVDDERAGMAELARLIDLVARSNIDVILLGETGVGKEVAAERVHAGSARMDRPLVRLNCSSLPDSLLEAELFGFEKGAFTGAMHAKAGLLESAHGGTVLLDEVGDLPMTTQPKLLRVIERREVMRIGSLKPSTLDVRFIAATHRDLSVSIAAGHFREDLYHRLNGITITIPPLRERRWQIAGLADTFLRDACAASGRPALALTPGARRFLEGHAWPGNVRQLRKTIERAVVLCLDESIDVRHIAMDGGSGDAAHDRGAAPGPDRALAALEEQRRSIERQRVLDALHHCDGNQTKTAQYLGVSRRTLLNWLDAYDLPRPRKRT